MALCGEIIAGHRVVRLLGRGGMAEVYEVEHLQLGLRRAMKVLVAKGERTEFLKSRFLAEGRLLARLDHPRIVKVHDCGVDESSGRLYLTMDLVHQLSWPSRHFLRHPRREGDRQAAGNAAMSAAGGESRKTLHFVKNTGFKNLAFRGK